MDSTERVLGRLEEHKAATDRRLDAIEGKIDALTTFKTKVATVVSVVSAVVSFVTTVLVQLFK